MDKLRIRPARIGTAPRFEPWIGRNYAERRDALLSGEGSWCDGLWHILGESHYGREEENDPQFTKRVVEALALPGYRFFDTILSITADKPVSEIDRVKDWQQFAYSNFIQDLLPDDDRRPHSKHWEKGRQAFFAQLAITRPKQLLVVGKSLWDNLPTEGYTAIPPFRCHDGSDDIEAGVYAYEVDGQTAFTIVTWIYHPSSRGQLHVSAARAQARTVTMTGCHILSGIGRDGEGWFA